MNINTILGQYGLYIAILLIAISIRLFVVYKKSGKDGLIKEAEKIALELMLGVERTVTSGVGADKMKIVTDTLYSALPEQVKSVVDPNKVSDFAQSVYDKARETANKQVGDKTVVPEVVIEVGKVVDSVVKDSISK